MKTNFALLLAALAATRASAQKACSVTEENAPSLTWSQCSEGGSCTEVTGGLVIDANWRWTHTVEGYDNCYTGAEWDTTLCPDGETCAENCCVDGADYEATYGVTTSGNSVSIRLVTENDEGTNVGARLYLTESEDAYQMFHLLGNEFSFTVDSSQVPCGLNGALYFISMDADGGSSKFPTNQAGAKYGTGYCDAQCARDLKWINGIVSFLSSVVVFFLTRPLYRLWTNKWNHRATSRTGRAGAPRPLMSVSATWAPAAPRWTCGVRIFLFSSLLLPLGEMKTTN